MPSLDWKHYTVIVLLLACLTTWGSRERSWSKRTEEQTQQIQTLNADKQTLATQKSTLEQEMKSDEETTEEVVPVQMPNGQIAYITRKTSKTVQEAIQRATSESQTRIDELTRQVTELKQTKKTDEHETVKTAPRWYAGADWQPLKTDSLNIIPHLGINLGSLTIYAGHPVGLDFEPHIGAGLRF